MYICFTFIFVTIYFRIQLNSVKTLFSTALIITYVCSHKTNFAQSTVHINTHATKHIKHHNCTIF